MQYGSQIHLQTFVFSKCWVFVKGENIQIVRIKYWNNLEVRKFLNCEDQVLKQQ